MVRKEQLLRMLQGWLEQAKRTAEENVADYTHECALIGGIHFDSNFVRHPLAQGLKLVICNLQL